MGGTNVEQWKNFHTNFLLEREASDPLPGLRTQSFRTENLQTPFSRPQIVQKIVLASFPSSAALVDRGNVKYPLLMLEYTPLPRPLSDEIFVLISWTIWKYPPMHQMKGPSNAAEYENIHPSIRWKISTSASDEISGPAASDMDIYSPIWKYPLLYQMKNIHPCIR